MTTWAAAACCVVLGACTSTPWPRTEVLVWKPWSPGQQFFLAGVNLDLEPAWGNLGPAAGDLAEMAARQAGLPWGVPGQGVPITLDLGEQTLGNGWENRRSVVAIMKVGAGEDRSGQVVFTEETSQTLRSPGYLYQVLETVFRALAARAGGRG